MSNLINRSNFNQAYYSNSFAIRQEIQRFEGVHPSIYAIYNLLEHADPLLAQQIREHVVCVEDSFVNSQEWTLSRTVSDLRLGVVGSHASGKSALVHRYLTGSYMQEESPEGGRFKKEVVIDGQSYLLLIRDEGGPPELQFSCWVDAVILVFSLENELSFAAITSYYTKICHYRNSSDFPVILVGTQDAISETNPRVIEDARARKLAVDLKNCAYYETCATYGLNVERVFQDACQRTVQYKLSTKPLMRYVVTPPTASPTHQQQNTIKESRSDILHQSFRDTLNPPSTREPTPCSTPTTARKNRRKSNIFTPLKKNEDDSKVKNGEVGSGRVIPIRQGYLYKRSNKTLNKEWKKKYVALTTDGMLTYHPSLKEYMDDVHGKDIPLVRTTVKVPGQRPRGMGSPSSSNDIASDLNNLSLNGSSTHLLGHDTPTTKKRHRRMKSISGKNVDGVEDSDGYEFMLVSLDNKQWQFEAPSGDERDAWITAIEQQILNSLQSNDSSKNKASLNDDVLQSIRGGIPGNTHCVDCGNPNPDWASLNLGALMCIECSGVHRNLGSHISRVRSLDLDDWPLEHLAVLKVLGNAVANSIWEVNTRSRNKPTSTSSREEKEKWIRDKYELKLFLCPINLSTPLGTQLIEAVCRSDIKCVALLLAHCNSPEQVNTCVGPKDQRTSLHLAAALGNLVILQLLLWYQADIKILDSDDRSALYYATACSHWEVEQFLRRAGCPETVTSTTVTNTLPRRTLSNRMPSNLL